MRGLILLGIALAFLATLILMRGGEDTLGGLSSDQLGSLVYGLAVLMLIGGSALSLLRHDFRRAVEGLAFWAALLVVLMAGYGYRHELSDVWQRVIGSAVPGMVTVNRAGEVVVMRGSASSFRLKGRINDREESFIFDTGASSVVLTAETARRAGLRIAETEYSITVQTANGQTQAAPVTVARLSIGDISQGNVRALVARQGALSENLLGMSFLERLGSYEVRGDRLILRP